MNILGAILAGGASRRFGSDKALVALGGVPWWERQRRVLTEFGATPVVLVRRPGQFAPAGIECWRDAFEGVGPIAGLYTALAGARTDAVAVLAVDMPGIAVGWFRGLEERCARGVGAVALHREAAEPLAAIYPAAARDVVAEQIARRVYSLQHLVARLAAAGLVKLVTVDETAADKCRSVNEPGAWREE